MEISVRKPFIFGHLWNCQSTYDHFNCREITSRIACAVPFGDFFLATYAFLLYISFSWKLEISLRINGKHREQRCTKGAVPYYWATGNCHQYKKSCFTLLFLPKTVSVEVWWWGMFMTGTASHWYRTCICHEFRSANLWELKS